MTDGRCVTAGWPFFQGAAFERPDGAVAVVVVNTADASTPKEFTTALFNRWGIGKAGANNGLLVVVSRITSPSSSGRRSDPPNT